MTKQSTGYSTFSGAYKLVRVFERAQTVSHTCHDGGHNNVDSLQTQPADRIMVIGSYVHPLMGISESYTVTMMLAVFPGCCVMATTAARV